jgi:hypothetical protein
VDNERQLRTVFRRALDDVLPPVPWLEAAVTENLRRRRTHRSVDIPRKSQPIRTGLPRPVVQLAAALLILVLAAVAVVTFLELRYSALQSAPAGALTTPSPSAPLGGPVPAELDGAWKQVATDPTVVMILTGTDVSTAGPLGSGVGKVAVNGSEIDFYNGTECNIALPGGIGKYRWRISAGLLTFSPLNSDPCPRAPYLADPKGWQRPT